MSDAPEATKLFVIILDKKQLIDELITGFLDIGVRGATIVETRGMGEIIRQDMPVFSGLASLFGESTGSRMVMSLMPESMVENVYKLVEEVVGQLDQPNSAICFTLPVDQFRGIRH
jgi:nitrogen regulatory protein P-II 1